MKKTIQTPAMVAAAIAMAFVPGRAQANNILGIDVSAYQGGSINWTSVKGDGVVFAFSRATTGYDYSEDSTYPGNMSRGKAAGVYMGAYHFSHLYANTPSEEATYFWNYAGGYIKADNKSLDPMVDFEVFSGHDGTSTYTAWFNDWSADVKAKTSSFMHPVIYCSACAGACDLIEYNDAGGITLSAWIADYDGENLYTGNPWGSCDCCNAWVTGCGTGNWTYWQVSDTGAISGISGHVDLDAYPLSAADLIAYQGVGN
jgi:lysozyme